jgi:hypothetical protein
MRGGLDMNYEQRRAQAEALAIESQLDASTIQGWLERADDKVDLVKVAIDVYHASRAIVLADAVIVAYERGKSEAK